MDRQNTAQEVANIAASDRAASLADRLDRLPPSKTIFIAVFLLSLTWITEAFDIGVVGSTIFLTTEVWNLTPSQVGFLGISGTLGILLGLLPSGALSDRYGRRAVLVGGLAVMGVFTLLAGLSPNIEVLILLRFIAGLGMGAVFPIPYILMLELAGKKSRYSLVSVQNGILAAAYLVPSLAAGFLVENLSQDMAWRASYLFAVPDLLLIPLILHWLPHSPKWLIMKGRFGEAERLIEKLESEVAAKPQRRGTSDLASTIGKSMTAAGASAPDADVMTSTARSAGSDLARSETESPERGISAIFSDRYRARSFVAFLAYSAGLLNWYVMLTYAPQFVSEYGFTTSASFFIAAAFVGIIAVGQFSQGFLASAKGLTFAIVFYGSIGTGGISLLALSAAVDIPGFVMGIAFFLTGLFGVGVVPMTKVFLAEQYPAELRGKGVGAGEFVARLMGGVLAIYYVPALVLWQGQAIVYLLCAVVLLFATIAVGTLSRTSRPADLSWNG